MVPRTCTQSSSAWAHHIEVGHADDESQAPGDNNPPSDEACNHQQDWVYAKAPEWMEEDR